MNRTQWGLVFLLQLSCSFLISLETVRKNGLLPAPVQSAFPSKTKIISRNCSTKPKTLIVIVCPPHTPAKYISNSASRISQQWKHAFRYIAFVSRFRDIYKYAFHIAKSSDSSTSKLCDYFNLYECSERAQIWQSFFSFPISSIDTIAV